MSTRCPIRRHALAAVALLLTALGGSAVQAQRAYQSQSAGTWSLQGGGALRMAQAVGTARRIQVRSSTLAAGTTQALSPAPSK